MDYNKIEDVETFIDAGSIKYEVEAFYMKDLNGDEKLEILRDKIEKKEHLTGNDILTLSFIPLMSSKESRSKRALQSIELADNIPEGKEKIQCLTLLYALFEKFGDRVSKTKFKEVFGVTEIGRMIREDGIREGKKVGKVEGKAEGKAEGNAELIIKQLTKRFKKVPVEYVQKIMKLPQITIDIIAMDIFDFESINDLDKYL